MGLRVPGHTYRALASGHLCCHTICPRFSGSACPRGQVCRAEKSVAARIKGMAVTVARVSTRTEHGVGRREGQREPRLSNIWVR